MNNGNGGGGGSEVKVLRSQDDFRAMLLGVKPGAQANDGVGSGNGGADAGGGETDGKESSNNNNINT